MEQLSKRREEDRRIRLVILEAMKVVLRLGGILQAKEMGQAARHLGEKVQSHDYSGDQTFEEIWRAKVEAGARKNGIVLPKRYWSTHTSPNPHQ